MVLGGQRPRFYECHYQPLMLHWIPIQCLDFDLPLTLALCWQKLGLGSNFGLLFAFGRQRWNPIVKRFGVTFAFKRWESKQGRVNRAAELVGFRSHFW